MTHWLATALTPIQLHSWRFSPAYSASRAFFSPPTTAILAKNSWVNSGVSSDTHQGSAPIRTWRVTVLILCPLLYWKVSQNTVFHHLFSVRASVQLRPLSTELEPSSTFWSSPFPFPSVSNPTTRQTQQIHNWASHGGSCHVNYARSLRHATLCPVVVQPVKRSDT